MCQAECRVAEMNVSDQKKNKFRRAYKKRIYKKVFGE